MAFAAFEGNVVVIGGDDFKIGCPDRMIVLVRLGR